MDTKYKRNSLIRESLLYLLYHQGEDAEVVVAIAIVVPVVAVEPVAVPVKDETIASGIAEKCQTSSAPLPFEILLGLYRISRLLRANV